MEALKKLTDAIRAGKRKDAIENVNAALAANAKPADILAALTGGMEDVGKRFKANEIFVPEVLIAARAMKSAMEVLSPVLTKSGIAPEFKIVIGTVKGDLHDIGKNIVAMMLRGANFQVIDLGVDVTSEAFVDAARKEGAHVIAMSALLTTTMMSMRETVDAVKAAGLKTKVIIGGAPVTDDFAKEIGADGYSADAYSAVNLARQLVA